MSWILGGRIKRCVTNFNANVLRVIIFSFFDAEKKDDFGDFVSLICWAFLEVESLFFEKRRTVSK